MGEMAGARFDAQIARDEAAARGEAPPTKKETEEETGGRGDGVAMQMIPVIELSRYCPGMVTAMRASVVLTRVSRCRAAECHTAKDARDRPVARHLPEGH